MAGPVIRVTVKTNRLQAIADKLPAVKRKRAERAGQRILQLAEPLTPVDTGYLLSRNQMETNGDGSVTVFNDAPYAGFVHDGTSRMAARPFLAQAAEDARGEYIADWQRIESDLT